MVKIAEKKIGVYILWLGFFLKRFNFSYLFLNVSYFFLASLASGGNKENLLIILPYLATVYEHYVCWTLIKVTIF